MEFDQKIKSRTEIRGDNKLMRPGSLVSIASIISLFVLMFLSQMTRAESAVSIDLNSGAPCTLRAVVDGTIGPATLDFIERALTEVKAQQCNSMLLLINTPGGALPSTRLIVERILNSPVPVLCLIHPSGAHAGSAGAIILQACHVAGAVSATNLGAATPIAGTGQELPEDLRKKMINDTTAWLDGLTTLRGRNRDFGRDIITEAKAVSAAEAFKMKAIDLLVSDISQFLDQARGFKVKLGQDQVVEVQVGELKLFEKDIRYIVLDFLLDPQFAYFLFMGSIALLYFEVTHPGVLVPGVIGSIGLVVAMMSLHKLNATWGGILLLLLGMVLLTAEALVPSFGALGLGGIVAFVMGSLLLYEFQTTGYTLPLAAILPTALLLGAVVLFLARLALTSFRVKRRGGYDELLEKTAEVIRLSGDQTSGQLRIHGETWSFLCDEPLDIGASVEIIGYQGLKLLVKKINSNNRK